MESRKKRVKALTLAITGSIMVVLLLIFLTWLLRVMVKWMGQDYWRDSNRPMEIDNNVSPAGVIEGITVGIQQVTRDHPYQLIITTYIAKSGQGTSKAVVNNFNNQVQGFVNDVKLEFENSLNNQANLDQLRLEIESQSIETINGLVVIDYKITKIYPDQTPQVSYQTLTIEM